MGIEHEYGEAFTPVDESDDPRPGGYDVAALFEAADQIIHQVDREAYWDDVVAATGDEEEAAAYEDALRERAEAIDERIVEVVDEEGLEHAEKRRRIDELRDPCRVLSEIDVETYPAAEDVIEQVRDAYIE